MSSNARGGLASKIHVVVDRKGLLMRLAPNGGHQHDCQIATELLDGLLRKDILLAENAYESTAIRACAAGQALAVTNLQTFLAFFKLASFRLWIDVKATTP